MSGTVTGGGSKGDTLFSYKVLPIEDYTGPDGTTYLETYPGHSGARVVTDTDIGHQDYLQHQVPGPSYVLPVETFPVENFTIYEEFQPVAPAPVASETDETLINKTVYDGGDNDSYYTMDMSHQAKSSTEYEIPLVLEHFVSYSIVHYLGFDLHLAFSAGPRNGNNDSSNQTVVLR